MPSGEDVVDFLSRCFGLSRSLSHHNGIGYKNGPTSGKLPAHKTGGTNEPANYTRATRSWAGPFNVWPDAAGALRRCGPTVPVPAELLSAFESTPCSRPTRFEPPGVPVGPSQSQSRATESNTADSCAAFAPPFYNSSGPEANDAWCLAPLRMRRLRSEKRSTSPVCMHLARAWARHWEAAGAPARLLLVSNDRHARGALRLWLPGALDT